jgi:hypothetical protein
MAFMTLRHSISPSALDRSKVITPIVIERSPDPRGVRAMAAIVAAIGTFVLLVTLLVNAC